MKDRCFNPNNNSFGRYGGRGIVVCERWRDSFESFFADIGPAPTLQHTIERINANGDYAPDNVRWATQTEQQRNRSTNAVITHNGESMPISAWAERTGIPIHTLGARVRRGWTTERALTETVRIDRRHS